MDSVSITNVVNNVLNNVDNFMVKLDNNKLFKTILGLFLVLYGSLVAPKLPKNMALLFKNNIFKFLIIFIIAYMASKDTGIAIIGAVAFLVSLQTLSSYETNKKILDLVEINSRFRLKNLLNKFNNNTTKKNINFFPYIPLDLGHPVNNKGK